MRLNAIGGTSTAYPHAPPLSTVCESIPIPEFDFNGEEVIDAHDMSIMVDHWHTDTSRYDLAPSPAGEGEITQERPENREFAGLSSCLSCSHLLVYFPCLPGYTVWISVRF